MGKILKAVINLKAILNNQEGTNDELSALFNQRKCVTAY